MTELWIIGAGGHAKVVIDVARAVSVCNPVGVLDDDVERLGRDVLGVPVCGPVDLASVERLGIERAILAIGNNPVRATLAARLDNHVEWVTLVHPSAVVASSAHMGEGSVVFAGAIVQPDAQIGRHVIVNTSASIDHDTVVGDFAHVGPGVRLAGNVRVGPGALLGIGSCVIPGCTIGAWATVGAGAVVVRDIPDGATAIGVPARCIPGRSRS